MSPYLIIPVVFAMVLTYLWRRHVVKNALKPAVRTRIVILGGGFGGLYSALQFEKTIAADPTVEVTLVSRENFVLFTPMLHEVAAGDLDMSDIVCPLRKMLKRVRFLQADVGSIDLETRQVSLAYGLHREQRVLTYDHLVIALGSEANFFNLPGVAERALTMKSLGDAFILRNHALGMLEAASATDDAVARRALLTFVVAGGGFAGVETLGALSDFVQDAIAYYPALAKEEPRLVLVHPSPVILPELNEILGRYAQKNLSSRKVEVRTDTRVTAFSDRGVELNNGETLATETLVWTAGVKPPEVLQLLPVKKEKGRIVVNEMLEAPDFPGVWAVGDCACILSHASGKPHPPTAQHALREAVCCANNVAAAIRGAQKTPFRFKALGQLATIGHRTGVANILGLRVSGFLAWWLWRTIYLAKLPTFEKKLRVALRWTLNFAIPKDLTQPVTLHGIDRVSQLLANAREHPVIPPSVASNQISVNAGDEAAMLNSKAIASDDSPISQTNQNRQLRVGRAASLALAGALGLLPQGDTFAANHPGSTVEPGAPKREWAASVHWENDTFGGTDRFYTDGISLNISHTGPSWMDPFADWLPWGEGRRTVGYEVTQGMFTPEDTTRSALNPNDRPYAGILTVGLTLHVEKDHSYHGLKLVTGVVGSWSLAEETQNAVHDVIGNERAEGWHHQLENEPIINLAYEYRHKFHLTGDRKRWSAQAFPLAGGWLGNMLVQGQAGGLLRFGYNVPDDFGPTLVRGMGHMPPPRRDAKSPSESDWGFSVYGGSVVNLVLRDLTLDGNTFEDSPTVDKKSLVPMAGVGVSVGNRRFQTSFAYIFWGKEFEGQQDHSKFGSLSLSYYF